MPSAAFKRCRRSATAVMAGAFDPRPSRDVLTSVLNGVSPYHEVERDEEARRKRKQEKKEREREKRRKARAAEKAAVRTPMDVIADARPYATAPSTLATTGSFQTPPTASTSKPIYVRPTIHIPAFQPSTSVTPSPASSPRIILFTPNSTPGPSISSSTSRTSSKRPRTPDDDVEMGSVSAPVMQRPPRKKRQAAKKGWKGWCEIEGSPPPSERLIKLDVPPVLQERRTRSGKSFDAIGVGRTEWV
ncbi:unnamed protein product [Cyclocybe aegerita]|uniref:Uncharacterized protein n=1 Tax=Cyclocybe aegerita TaxID=1973307 RepID=A0A8S0XZQ6_CYCAE|nr:unnamed protein product [Cyclocybe aegerita]